MVVIKKRNNIIPVEFGEFTLEFLSNDASIRKMEEVGKKLQKEGGELAEKADDLSLIHISKSVALLALMITLIFGSWRK